MKVKQTINRSNPITVRYDYEWMKTDAGLPDFIESVLVWHFDDQAKMGVEVLVHWTRFFEYRKNKWPNCGEVKAVVTNRGRKIYATMLHASFHFNEDWHKAPEIIAKAGISVVTLQNRHPLVCLRGAEEWSRNRDNSAFEIAQNVNLIPYE